MLRSIQGPPRAADTGAALLEAAGARAFAINAGGAILSRGGPEPGRAWWVGIRHPVLADRVAIVLAAGDLAIATSDAYERGERVVDPRAGRPVRGLLSTTVAGPSLTWADAFATTAFAMGFAGLGWVARHPCFGALAITDDERVAMTPLVDRLVSEVDSPRPGAH